MNAGAAVRESLATVPGAILVQAEPGRAGEATQQIIAAGSADIVLLLIDSAIPPLDRAMLIAATGLLSVELAPHTRLGTISVSDGAESDDVAAAARFLAAARSTTGQVLTVAARN